MPNSKVFHIPAENIARFQGDIERLIKRADKLDVPAPGYKILRSYDETTEVGFSIEMYEVEVYGDAPRFNGWRFIAAIDIDRENPDAPNIVYCLAGVEKDPEWTTTKSRCDHCLANRDRKKLVVVEHDNGERKIVGSTCLHDFLGGKSPKAIAAWAEMLSSFVDDENGYREVGKSAEARLVPAVYLAWVIKAIREGGWISRGTAKEDEVTATADDAVNDMMAYHLSSVRSFDDVIPTIEDHSEAQTIIEWGQGIDIGQNDYMDNLAAVAQKSGWRMRDLGLGASMVTAYRKRHVAPADVAPAPADSQHVGEVDEPVELIATIVLIREIETKWGPKVVADLHDRDGNVLVWWAKPDEIEDFKEGDVLDIQAVVSKHDTFRGVAQTTIKFVEAMPAREVSA